MTTCQKCGARWTGFRIEHCVVCCETFSSTRAGDAHRVGDYAARTRRCLSAEEMSAKGLVPRTKPSGLVIWGRPGSSPHSDADSA